MSTVEMKKKLHKLIDAGDDEFLRHFYEVAKSYEEQRLRDQMIEEGEEDIEAGRTYSLKEAKKIIDSWEP